MSTSTSLIKRAVAILKNEGLRGLSRRTVVLGKMQLLSVLQRYEHTKSIYYLLQPIRLSGLLDAAVRRRTRLGSGITR
jgi:hypothetical protein